MIQITWLGHGTYQFALESGEVYIVDPWIEGNPKYPAGHTISRLDGILLTHAHFDHVGDVVKLAGRFPDAPVAAIYELATWLGGKGIRNVMGFNKGGSVQIGPLKVTMTHALHSSGIIEDGNIIYGGEPAGFILTFPDGRVAYCAGDTTVFSDMALYHTLYQPELAILPIGDLYTMSPKEAALACQMIKAKKVIPVHWGTFPPLTGTPAELAKLIEGTGTSVWELEPGKSVAW
jgi:L-ascorbate metabolism protein UlaG (beta-lactamase superfamily)